MGSKQGTNSVIAKLMDLDDLSNQHSIQKRGRVLSERYYRRVASIVVRERSPSLDNYSMKTSSERPEDFIAFIRVIRMPRQDKLDVEAVECKRICVNGKKSQNDQSPITSANSSYTAREGKEVSERFSMHNQQMKHRSHSSHDLMGAMKKSRHNVNRFKRFKLSGNDAFKKPSSRESGITYNEDLQPGKDGFFHKKSRNSRTSFYETLAWKSQMIESDTSYSNYSEDLAKEEEQAAFLEEYSISLRSLMGPESFKSIEEACQPSPDSVLEPFGKENSSDTDSNLSGLQIFPSKLESLEQWLEGHGVSSPKEEDNDAHSLSNSEEAEDAMIFSTPEESRDFSYLVNVLSEAGILGPNLIDSLTKWHSTESPVDSSVFEALEKKYGEQKSWIRSERKLLFDRINLGLTEILLQSVGVPSWAKPVSTASYLQRTEVIKKALWALMVRKENEAKKISDDDVLGDSLGWLEYRESVDLVSEEIEKSLIDELEAEFF